MTWGTTNQTIIQGETPVRVLARDRLWMSLGSVPVTMIAPGATQADPEALFEYERMAFRALLPGLQTEYAEQYVAVHGGKVVDADPSRRDLVRRFFERFGDTHVYVGFVGATPVVHQLSPFRF